MNNNDQFWANSFKELSVLNSDKVFVINNYKGLYQIDKIPTSVKVVIYINIGELVKPHHLDKIMNDFQNYYLVVVTPTHYQHIPSDGTNYKLIYAPWAYYYFNNFLNYYPNEVKNKVFDKTFLSLNFRADVVRHALAQFVLNFDLLDKMFFSYHCHDRFKIGHRAVFDKMNQTIGETRTWFNSNLDYEEFYNQLPISTELELSKNWDLKNVLLPDNHENIFYKTADIGHYTRSFCSIVTETYVNSNQHPFLTEKSFKPIAYAHPFIIIGSAGSLGVLKNLGYKTFSNVFDESYDLIENPTHRLEAVFQEILRICNLDRSELEKIHQETIPIVDYNYSMFWNEFPKIYKNEIQQLEHQLLNIINNL